MSSPDPSFASSAPSHMSPRRASKSQFTYKHLSQLKSYSVTTPLRVIAHVDLDAFYAQCETVRLGLDPTKPLAVQQWQGLIAINYPARAYGLSRHVTSTEALKVCPHLIMQHVATWKEGDEKWAYHEDAFKHIATHKVSLDPYRKESRRILQCIKDCLPRDTQRVEKASVDEVFLDLGAQVHGILLERYPELQGPPPYDDDDASSEYLPRPPTTVLDWAADAVVGTGEEDGEDRDPDWDDVCVLIASEIVRDVRRYIYDHLGYTCSAGVSRNKMLAKLGSGHKKPNSQTIIRHRAIRHFLSEFKFTKIRNLGGKLGDEVVAIFGTDTVKELLAQPIEQLKKRLGDDTGSWLYSTIRGEDNSEVNPRTQIKSMLSAKSFRPAINSFEQGVRWLRIFVADIFSRCVEEGVLENKRRPRTINLHHRQGAQTTRSRQSPIPQGKPLSEAMLFHLAKNLLAQIVVDGRAWPCINLSLSVAGFEDGIMNNKGIGGFLVRGEEAKAMLSNSSSSSRFGASSTEGPPTKKRKREKGNIKSFFGTGGAKKKDFDAARAVLKASRDSSTREEKEDEEEEEEQADEDDDEGGDMQLELDMQDSDESDAFEPLPRDDATHKPRPSTPTPNHHHHHTSATYDDDDDLYYRSTTTPPSAQPPTTSLLLPHNPPNTDPSPPLEDTLFFCSRCNAHLSVGEKAEHDDFHFAMDLSEEMRREERSGGNGNGNGSGSGSGSGSGMGASSRPPVPPSATKTSLMMQKPGRGGGRLSGGRGASASARASGPTKGQAKLAFTRQR
ncbi:DNA/RNA polymerase [Pleomassaria siparia CBS 279.74]|uniref:DNA polymerase eta n=1 Tax=Pleomassaria siparia CBS 279.74 TaxID=1314801 RepID=A0A6G1KNN5_9PLEO|nr:DNA/RNA polymerase [Pleomassaria siparia CBS 279.74]